MPLPLHSILQIELHLRNQPDNLTPAERHRAIALTAISYAGSLGRVVSNLTTMHLCGPDAVPARSSEEFREEFDSALYVLGELQAVLNDTAYGAVEEMFIALTEPADVPKETPRVTKATRITKEGRARHYKQQRGAGGRFARSVAA